MTDGAKYADLLKILDPYYVSQQPSQLSGGILTNGNSCTDSVDTPPVTREMLPPPTRNISLNLPLSGTSTFPRASTPSQRLEPLINRPETPVIRASEYYPSVTQISSASLPLPVSAETNTSQQNNLNALPYFTFIKKEFSQADVDSEIENTAESQIQSSRSLAFADVPIDGEFFVKIAIKVLCLPEKPTFELVENVQVTVSDLICRVMQTLDDQYESGILSTAVGFELRCAKTNECLSGNGKLAEYRVFTTALRFECEPVKLILAVAKPHRPGKLLGFCGKNDLTCQKALENALKQLDDLLKFVSNPLKTPDRIYFQKLATTFREVEVAMNLQHTSLFRRTIFQFEKLASSVLQTPQNVSEICRRSAKNVVEFVNAFAEAFEVPFQVRLTLGGTASSFTQRDSVDASVPSSIRKRGKLSLSLSTLHRVQYADDQLNIPPTFVECSIVDIEGNEVSEPSSISFTFEHKLKCSTPNTLTFISHEDEHPLPLAYLDNLSPISRLMIRVYSILPTGDKSNPLAQKRSLVGWANVNLFDQDGCLKSGLRIIPLWAGDVYNPQVDRTICSCTNTNDSTCLLIVAAFHADHPLYVQSNSVLNPYSNRGDIVQMPTEIEERLYRSLFSDLTRFSEEDRIFFWENRNLLRFESRALPIVLWCAPRNSPHIYNELITFISDWGTLPGDPLSVLRFLLPGMISPIVTDILSAILIRKICPDSVIDLCMPQFVQALRRHGVALANALIRRCSDNHELSVTFYWLLAYEAQNCDFICCRTFYSTMSILLRSRMAGTRFIEEITNQHFAVMHVMTMAEKIHHAKNNSNKIDLQRELRNYIKNKSNELPEVFTFPCVGGADTRLSGLDAQECAVLSSRAAPLRLKFTPCMDVDSASAPLMCIVKVGDDLRNDMVALQLVRIMDYIWMSCQLDMKVITFSVLPTDLKQGIIQFVPGVEQLRVAQGGLSRNALIHWFASKETDDQLDPALVDTFTRTCAAWCVASYIIGVGDRHNDNILLNRSTGHLFHIDFGKLFGDAEKFAGFRRDRVPFVFTDQMAMLIAGGQEFGQDFAQAGYRQFVDTCCLAFNLIRRRGESLLLSAVTILRFPLQNVQYLRDCLMLNLSDSEASVVFEKMISESLKSVAPQFNFWVHSLAQSFVKQPPMLANASTSVKTGNTSFDVLTVPAESLVFSEVTQFHKVRYPVKHYMFQISVYPEQVSNLTLTAGGGPLLIFRRFSEVNDLRDSLISEFPVLSQQIPPFKTRGSSENRELARKRMLEINNFFQSLFSLSLEIRRSPSIAKFFKVRPMDLRSANGFVKSVTASSLPQDGQLWMTVTLRRLEAPILEVLVHRGVNFFFDENNNVGRVRVSLLVKDNAIESTFSVDELNGGYSKFRTDLAPPGSQPLFNKLFVWNLPATEKWPSDFCLFAKVQVHPLNPVGLSPSSTSSAFPPLVKKNLGKVRIVLTKMITWATSWPVVDSQYFRLMVPDN